MRLICPNCDAQYEVDAAMIPASGRDVQCSSCGRTWFQGPLEAVQVREPEPEAEPEPEEDALAGAETLSGDGLWEEAAEFFGETPKQVPEEVAEPEPEEVGEIEEPAPDDRPAPSAEPEDAAGEAPAEDRPSDEPSDEPSDDMSDADDEDFPDDDEGPAPVRERPPIDPKVLGILRAEAEREIAARRAEAAQSLETQADLGLADRPHAPKPRSDAEIRTARLRGHDEEDTGGAARNTILPDIEDINASLTATSDRDVPETPIEAAEGQAKRRAGFRTGFSLMMLAVAAVILVYLFAPQIAAAVPALEPMLVAYVDWANGMRLAIDEAMAGAVEALSGS